MQRGHSDDDSQLKQVVRPMGYRPELDGLRAMAVIAVILFHCGPGLVFRGGFIGVDLFFVLSAFLISGKLAEGQSLKTFYWHRFLRLYPALLLMLVTYILVAPSIWPDHHHVLDALIAGTYLSNWTYTVWEIPYYLRHTWSLAIEEQFYILWPLLLPFFLRARRPLIWLGLAYVALTFWRSEFAGWTSFYYRLDTHATGLVLGALLFFWRGRISSAAGWIGLLLFVGLCFAAKITSAKLYLPFAEVASLLLVAAPPAFFKARPLAHIGKLSYALYLWHFPISFWAKAHFDYLGVIAVTLAMSYALSLLSYYTVEAWGRRMKNRNRMDSFVKPAALN